MIFKVCKFSKNKLHLLKDLHGVTIFKTTDFIILAKEHKL